MIAESPRVRMSVLGIVVFALFASLFARLYYLQVMATDQYQVAAQANRIRVVPVEAPRGRILDRNGKVLVDNRISVQVTIDRTVLDELDDDERTGVLTALADGARSRRASPRPSRSSRPTSPTALQPVRAGAGRRRRARGAQDLDRRARRRAARASPPSGWPCAATRTASWPPTCSATPARSTTRSSRRKADSPKPYTLNDEIGKYGVEKIYEDDLRGTPGLAVDRGRRREPADPRSSTRTPPIPGDDLVLNLDIDVQAQAEQALQSGLEIAKDRPCTRLPVDAEGREGLDRRPRPEDGRRASRWRRTPPSTRPTSSTASATSSGRPSPPRRTTPRSTTGRSRASTRPGSTFKPFSAVAGLESGLITPDTTVYDDGEYEVPDCTRRLVRVQQRPASKPYGVVDLRRSLTVSSDFYYYGLGAQFWIQQDRLGGPERYADLLKQWGFDSDTGIDLSSEQSGRIPSPAWLAEYCADVGCVDGADSWRTGNNVNMAIGQGDVLLTPLQLASGYATIGNGGTVWQPHVVKEVRDGVTKRAEAHHRAEGAQPDRAAARVAAGALRRPHRRHHAGRRHRGRRLQRLPARHVPDRRQDGHRAGRGAGQQGAHRGVRRLRPGHRRPVRHLRAARGGRLRRLGGGARRSPPLRRAARPRPARPPAPEGGRFEVLDSARAHRRGRARLMAATTTFSTRERVAPGALGRLSRNPAAPWRHIDLVLVGCIVAVAALGLR